MPDPHNSTRTPLFSTAQSRTRDDASQGKKNAATPRENKGRKVLPVFGYGSDGGEHRGKAEDEDRNTREKWGTTLRSAYLSQLQLPDSVGPGDTDTARQIVLRLDRLLDQLDGQWTRLERARLRGMKKAWEERAAGQSPLFNAMGWRKKQTYRYLGEFAAWQEARKIDRIIREIRSVLR